MIPKPKLEILPYGENAILILFPEEVSPLTLVVIKKLSQALQKDISLGAEFVSAYHSLTLIYRDPVRDFYGIKEQIKRVYDSLTIQENRSTTFWKLPVLYNDEMGPDLNRAALTLGISKQELIRQHTQKEFTIYGIGFLPGFMYLGGLPETLEIPRLKEPRLKVAKGSVGLAGKQTGIYPQESPGGWNLIGNCPVPLFDPSKDTPCFVSVGDKIKFEAVDQATYNLIKVQLEVGLYKPEKSIG